MNQPTPLLSENSTVLIETEDLILHLDLNQLLYAKVSNSFSLELTGKHHHFNVNHNRNQVIQLLIAAGFIRINSSYYINPAFISEYKLKEQCVEFTNGISLPILNAFSQNLLNYLKTIDNKLLTNK